MKSRSPGSTRSLPRRLRVSELRWTCPASWVAAKPGKSTRKHVDPMPDLIGQGRALEALEMGITVNAHGYNVFVTGLGGEEREHIVADIIKGLSDDSSEVYDHVFVHNFADPLRPRHLALPARTGPKFRDALQEWKRALLREIPRLLDGSEHMSRQRSLMRRYTQAEEKLFKRLERRAKSVGLILVEVEDESGTHQEIHFLIEDAPVAPNAISKLPAKKRPKTSHLRQLTSARDRLLAELRKAHRQAHALALRLLRESRLLDETRTREMVENLGQQIQEELHADEKLGAWLQQCTEFVLANLDLFRRGSHQADELNQEIEEEEERPSRRRRPGLEVFDVNVVRTLEEPNRPNVFELHPNYSNLFGTVERRVLASGPGYYHLAVRPGSMLSADGGFLVLNARDVLEEAEVWRALKRTLQNNRLELHALEALSPLGVTGVRPEPIPLEIKVVLVGDNFTYERLHDRDFDFQRIFKVKAEFDDSLPVNRDFVQRFVRVIQDLGRKEKLLNFAPSGLQALVERAARDAGRRNRLSARLGILCDYARESSFYARKAKKRRVDRRAVEEAAANFRRQHALDDEWHHRMVMEDVFEIATSGARVGTVNALTVVGLGPLGFGRTAPISAMVSAGEESYLCIDREVDLSGPIHTKGILMMESFIRGRFGQARTLAMRVALTFDQSYGPIDGDSASSTEIYALLSAMGDLPIRQNVAITGAVNMRGDVLSVGSVNEKVEGFFQICKERGLTGEQGVMIPTNNVEDLMLDNEIIAAVRKNLFHLWAVDHVDQGIALLTGLPAGKLDNKGRYPKNSVMGRIEARLDQFERNLKGEERDATEAVPKSKSGKQAARSAMERHAPQLRQRRRR